jgi:pyrroline-5-carboxylate reductase
MTIAIIGTGNMGGAIMRGLVKSGTCLPEQIICTAKTEATLNRIKEYNANIRVSQDNAASVAEADIVVLAVKPWLIASVMEEICPILNKQIVVSVAAGVTLHDLAVMAGKELPIFRAIPNTAVEALCGVTFIAQHGASDEQAEQVRLLFSALGYASVVDESLIPAGTALASCGIAFAMRYIRAAMEGGVELGFRPEEAARIVEHTVKGAATLLLESGAHPEVEIDKVTTAGGITIKGLNAMEKAGFTAAVIEGLKASNV